MRNNLTTLTNVQDWLGDSSGNDALLNRLIAQASRFIYGQLNRSSLFRQTYNDVYDGTGSRRLMLRNWPVVSVASLSVGTQIIGSAPQFGQTGYWLETDSGAPPGRPQALDLNGYRYGPGYGNVAVTYDAGYVIRGEPYTVPSAGPYTVTADAPYGNWAVDEGVTYAVGVALTRVDASPIIGQYSVAEGVYTFAAADQAAAVLISYSYVPYDLEQACIEMVGERYKAKDRIGIAGKGLAGQETITYNTRAMPNYVTQLIQPYASVLMI